MNNNTHKWSDNQMREFAAYYTLKSAGEDEFHLFQYFDEWAKSKEKPIQEEPKEISRVGVHDTLKGNNWDSYFYQFCSSKPLNFDLFPVIKQAIENAINEPKSKPLPTKEEVSKSWEILSFKCSIGYITKNPDGTFGQYECIEQDLLSSSVHQINSVKRLSDNQIFSIGEEVEAITDSGKGFIDTISHFTFTKGVDIIDIYFKNHSGAFSIIWLQLRKIHTKEETKPILFEANLNLKVTADRQQVFINGTPIIFGQ